MVTQKLDKFTPAAFGSHLWLFLISFVISGGVAIIKYKDIKLLTFIQSALNYE